MYKFTKTIPDQNRKYQVDLCFIFKNEPGRNEIYFGEYDHLNRPCNHGWLYKFEDNEFRL